MATPQERVVGRARAEVGYVPTHGKFNKYARVLDQTGLYNYPKDGYDWCDISLGGTNSGTNKADSSRFGCLRNTSFEQLKYGCLPAVLITNHFRLVRTILRVE